MRATLLLTAILPGLLFSPAPASAQDDGPVDIEVGSKRIGGPGTQEQRKSDDAWDKAVEEEYEPMTEETLPPVGSKKRMPALVGVVLGGTCLGCRMNVPPQLYNNLRVSLGTDVCPSCNRIIYAVEALETPAEK